MFIGHYGPAFAGVRVARSVPLWVLFLSVQIVDVAWGLLVALGIEKVRVEPGFTATSPFDLYHMPYTHSLPGAVVFAVAIGLAYAVLARRDRLAGGVVVGLASMSHWLLDLLVHIPDLPLWPGGPKVGFGLWEYRTLAILLEAGVLLAGFWLYLTATRAKGLPGRASPWLLVLALFAAEAYHLSAPPAGDAVTVGLSSLMVFLVFTGLAALVDVTREARP